MRLLRSANLLWIVVFWTGAGWLSYRHVIIDLLQQWQANPSYSHGPLVVPIALWLLWHRRSSRPSLSRPWHGGLGLLLAAHILLWLGGYFYVPAVARWSLPLWVAGLVGLLCGRRMLIWSLPGIGLLAFMIPLPFQLESLANQALQWTSAWCSCVALGLTSTLAVTDGYTLKMTSGRVGITTDCSGLRMTIAIAAVSYVLSFVRPARACDDQCGRSKSPGITVRLGIVLLSVIPAAIFANAIRITALAWVMNRFQEKSYTTWAHDLGDWLVLPVAAAAFLVIRHWLGKVIRLGCADTETGRRGQNGGIEGRRMSAQLAPWISLAMPPATLVLLSSLAIWHYQAQRDQFTSQMAAAARDCEAAANWKRAARCYRELAHWQSSPVESHVRLVRIALQSATGRHDRQQASLRLEGILQRSPRHVEALRMQLDLALELANGDTALRCAEQLYRIDHHDPTTLQMCVETQLRFPSRGSRLPALAAASSDHWLERMGPVSTWRDGLVIEVAAYCSEHPESLEPALRRAIRPAITSAANRIGTAKAHFESWRFERAFGNHSPSLEQALECVGENCANDVAHEIYLASAHQAFQENEMDRAKRLVTEAIKQIPADHRAYELLGDLHHSERDHLPSTAAYLRAWRLAGDRPLELGIKLAESLVLVNAHGATTMLTDRLAVQIKAAYPESDRALRIRLQLVQTRLDLRKANYEQAMQKLERCQALISLLPTKAASSIELNATIERLAAQCLVRMGRYADAARLFEERALRSSSPADQWKAAARAWRRADNVTAAERCYRRAVIASAYDADVWLELVQVLNFSRGVDEAATEVALRQRHLGQEPTVSERAIAQGWEIVGKPQQAIELLQRTLAADPDNVVVANNLAMLLADDAQKLEQALECIDRVLEQAGPVAEFLDTKGWILVLMDRADEALPWLAEAAERTTAADPVAHLHLATAYMVTGDHDRAREYLESARGGQLRLEWLNTSERRAWENLQQKLSPPKTNRGVGDT